MNINWQSLTLENGVKLNQSELRIITDDIVAEMRELHESNSESKYELLFAKMSFDLLMMSEEMTELTIDYGDVIYMRSLFYSMRKFSTMLYESGE